MTITESDRLALYDKMKGQVGKREAQTLMNLLPTMDWNEIATKTDLGNLDTGLRAEMSELRADMNGRFAEIDGRFAQIDRRFAKIDGQFAEVDGRFATSERKITALLIGFALSMWFGFLATILTIVYSG